MMEGRKEGRQAEQPPEKPLLAQEPIVHLCSRHLTFSLLMCSLIAPEIGLGRTDGRREGREGGKVGGAFGGGVGVGGGWRDEEREVKEGKDREGEDVVM